MWLVAPSTAGNQAQNDLAPVDQIVLGVVPGPPEQSFGDTPNHFSLQAKEVEYYI